MGEQQAIALPDNSRALLDTNSRIDVLFDRDTRGVVLRYGRANFTVVSGINHLPERTREIFLMHRIDKLEYSEIAQRLGISESAIEKQMAKAMVALADYAKAW